MIYRYGGFSDLINRADLSQQALLAGLAPSELNELAKLAVPRVFKTGERIIAAGDPAASVFFLQSGMVSVKLGNGTRLASLVPGVAFGEMALIEGTRLADVWADNDAWNWQSNGSTRFAKVVPVLANVSRVISRRPLTKRRTRALMTSDSAPAHVRNVPVQALRA